MVVFPPLREQQKIVDFLTILDRRIDVQRKKVEALKKYKRGLLNQIFSAISKGSQRRKLRELVHVSGGKTPSMSNSLYWNGDIVWISSKDMKSSRISGSELKITNLALNEMTLYHPGTLLLVARSGILKHSLPLAMGAVSTLYLCFRVKDDIVLSDLAKWYFESSQWHRGVNEICAEGARNHGLLNVPTDGFFNTVHTLPSDPEEQLAIASYLSLFQARLDSAQAVLEKLLRIRSGLMQRIFT